jgi:hypothetical protein
MGFFDLFKSKPTEKGSKYNSVLNPTVFPFPVEYWYCGPDGKSQCVPTHVLPSRPSDKEIHYPPDTEKIVMIASYHPSAVDGDLIFVVKKDGTVLQYRPDLKVFIENNKVILPSENGEIEDIQSKKGEEAILREREAKKLQIGQRFSKLGILNESYSSGLPKNTRTLGEAGVKVVLDRLREKPCDYVLYGSFPLMANLLPAFRRTPGDIDIQLMTGKHHAEDFSKELLTRLKNIGEKVRLSPQNPVIIESFKTGKWERAVDIHHKEEAPEDILSPLSSMNLPIGKSSGRTRVQSLVDALDFFRIMSSTVEQAKQNHLDERKIAEAQSLMAEWKDIFSEDIDFEKLEIKGGD